METERKVYNLIPALEAYPVSQALKVGDTIYLSGNVAFTEAGEFVGENDMMAQTRQVYKNITKTLAHFGASLKNIVEVFVFVTDIDRMEEVVEVTKDIYGEQTYPPVSVGVEVRRLSLPEMLVEIKVTARL
ncbi:MAG: RidA family protein [Deltaproteobacteria bacterium]|nr:RidA family protein [Deltaproteobacteria bacterium]